MTTLRSLVADVVASPLGQVIAQVGMGVADAQEALDEGSLARVLEIYSEGDDAKLALLREIGYRPTFYALPETTGEVRVALRLGQGAQGLSGPVRAITPAPATSPAVRAVPARLGLTALPGRMYAAPVDAGYANAYGFQADIAAKLTFRIVPIPPPEGADELRRVPDLAGRTLEAARAVLEALGLIATLPVDAAAPAGTTPVAGQDPPAGAILRTGEAVALTLTT